jgi:plastocyanin
MQFEPAELVVKRGDRIVWINKDFFPHTATAETFDSGKIAPAASWSLLTSKPGVLTYVCALHPTMKAKLIVQ